MIVDIIPEKRFGVDKSSFSYTVPEEFTDLIKIGSICNIPFGKNNIRGVVTEFKSDDVKFNYEIKEISGVDPEFVLPEKYIEIAIWMSKYYLCSPGETISFFLPPKKVKARKSAKENKAIDSAQVKLNHDQSEIFKELKSKLECNNKKPSLLLGVTGSGKTEIYLKLCEEVINLGKQVIVLVPEIILTPQTVERFERKFEDKICMMHSGLSAGERFLSYSQFYNGEKKILIGPRSALLVPSKNLGLIIVDEEQEDAFKQEKDPRYHAVTLAKEMSKILSCDLLLGTATPRIETYFKCKNGQIDLFELKNRYGSTILPPAKIVDLRNEIKKNNMSPISETLHEAIEQTLKNKRHVILYLNRRGMSTFVSCRDCGEVITCPNCEIPMVYHINFNDVHDKNVMNCHHCDHEIKVPANCPNCQGTRIKFFGAGVERVEQELLKDFPKARIKRIDSKTMSNKTGYSDLHREIKECKFDILLGTQILAKGLDIPTVDLVGIVSADTGLQLPYFRAHEKVFSLITQVSGRSGRRDNPGQTVIQTYWPDSFVIQCAAMHDFKSFYNEEIKEREEFCYPPFCNLIRIVAEDENREKAKKRIMEMAEKLRTEEIDFIGPGQCFFARLNNRFRYHIIIKTKKMADDRITKIYESNPYLVWDPDPVDLL